MVDEPDKRNDVLMQGREPPQEKNNILGEPRAPERMERKESGGRLPYPGELVGNKLPPYDVTGLDALSPLLNHVEFPATRADVIEAIGQARIAIDKSTTRSVADVLDKVTPTTFRSHVELENAVKQVWDQILPHSGDGRGSRHFQRDDLSGQKRSEDAPR